MEGGGLNLVLDSEHFIGHSFFTSQMRLDWVILDVPLAQWFSTGVDFAPRGHLAMSGDDFGCRNLGGGTAAGI